MSPAPVAPSPTPTTWVFDVDACLVDSLTGSSLRPGARTLLATLRTRAQRMVLWSAGGADYARARAEQHAVAGFFDAFVAKDGRDEHGRYLTSVFLDDLAGVVFVDDRTEDLPRGAEVIPVTPYLAPNEHDRGLSRVAERVGCVREILQ
jgi:long-chain acyl-CoA synthetase